MGSPYVVAELDYLLATGRGVHAELAVLTELSGGAWELPSIDPSDLRDACAMIERYQDQEIGVADASLVVLADRYRTDRLLNLDQRHFRVVRTAAGTPLTCCPKHPDAEEPLRACGSSLVVVGSDPPDCTAGDATDGYATGRRDNVSNRSGPVRTLLDLV